MISSTFILPGVGMKSSPLLRSDSSAAVSEYSLMLITLDGVCALLLVSDGAVGREICREIWRGDVCPCLTAVLGFRVLPVRRVFVSGLVCRLRICVSVSVSVSVSDVSVSVSVSVSAAACCVAAALARLNDHSSSLSLVVVSAASCVCLGGLLSPPSGSSVGCLSWRVEQKMRKMMKMTRDPFLSCRLLFPYSCYFC